MQTILAILAAILTHAALITAGRGVFQFSQANVSMSVGQWAGVAATGSLVWPRLDAVPPAEFTVLASLLSPDEVQSILDVVEDESLEFDEDRDSVDDQATHEFYLERSGSVDGVRGITGKPDGDARVFASRLAARERLQEITRPIMQQRVVPFVNQAYASACKSNCFVCHSLIRRWRQDERVKHPTHFDIQALVTVVVSLTSYGKDFIGGLYVSTGERESYLALQAGDAVVHQSTLLHGVDVESGKRWSWIMWFKDTPDCDRADHTSWTLEEATAGNPLAQFLHARRVSSAIERAKWLQRSANAGFARAQNELGWALFQGDGVRANLVSAKKWLKKAADQGEAEAHYNLGLIAAQQGMIDEAVALFKTAAAGGVAAAMFNIGVSYYKGSHGLQQDLAAAWHWLEQSGDGTGLFLAAGIADGTDAAAGERLRQRSCATGHAPACAALASSAPDARQAKAWLAKAAKYGDKQAVRALQNEL